MVDDSHNDERLAMLLDAKLSPRERERLLSELADNPELLAILADASANLGAAQSVARQVATPQRSPRRPAGSLVWLAAAAAIFIALSFGVWRMRPQDSPGERVLALVEGIEAQRSLPDDWSEPSWTRTRGAGTTFDRAGTSVLLGARSADLAFAERQAPDRVGALAGTVSDLARGIPGSGPAVAAWEAAWRAGSESDSQARADALRGLEELTDPDYFTLGAILEGLRIAVLSGDTASLSSLANAFRARNVPAAASERERTAIAGLTDLLQSPAAIQLPNDQLLRSIDEVFLAVLQGPSGSV